MSYNKNQFDRIHKWALKKKEARELKENIENLKNKIKQTIEEIDMENALEYLEGRVNGTIPKPHFESENEVWKIINRKKK